MNRGRLDAETVRDAVLLAFPTIKTLEGLATFASADALVEWASGQTANKRETRNK